MVREELTSEEKFFEKSVITEKFVKKYKKILIGGFLVILGLIITNIIYETNKESNIVAANEALSALYLNDKDEQALLSLKASSPKLYDAYAYSRAILDKDMQTLETLKSSKSTLVRDLSAYETSKDTQSLDEYALKQTAIYKDLALIRAAILLINDAKIQKGHEKLGLISENSSLSKIAQSLLHYGVK